MTDEEMRNLQRGDLIRHKYDRGVYVVTGTYGGRVTAVRSVDITNSIEWDVIARPKGLNQ